MWEAVEKGVYSQTFHWVRVCSYTPGSQREAYSGKGFLWIHRDRSRSRKAQETSRGFCSFVISLGNLLVLMGSWQYLQDHLLLWHTEGLFSHLVRRPKPLYWASKMISVTVHMCSCWGSQFPSCDSPPPFLGGLCWAFFFPFSPTPFNSPSGKACLKRTTIGVYLPLLFCLQNNAGASVSESGETTAFLPSVPSC